MPALVAPEELRRANKFRRLWSVYEQNADLVQVGAYEHGSNPELDEAIQLREQMVQFLRQEMHASEDYNVCRMHLQHIVS